MSINLINLPRNVFENVSSFLDDRTFLRLRQVLFPVPSLINSLCLLVSKTIKNLVDVSSLKARKTIVSRFTITEYQDKSNRRKFPVTTNKCTISIFFERTMDYVLWKNCILASLPAPQLIIFEETFNASCFTSSGNTYVPWIMATLNMDKIRIFLASMQPLIRASEFENLCFYYRPEIVEMCTMFFESKSIPTVSMYPWSSKTEHNAASLDLIKKMKAMYVTYEVKLLTNETIEILFKLADFAKKIEIRIGKGGCRNYTNIALIVREIMNRKCEYVKIHDYAYATASTTIADVEQLVQFFHTLDKKVEFEAGIYADPMHVNIGEYVLFIRGNGGNQPYHFLSIFPI